MSLDNSKLKMETFRELIVNINVHGGIQKPEYTTQNRFYKVYSPEKFKLRPQEDIHIDLKFDIQYTPETIQPWLNLLPSLNEIGMHIENDDRTENKTKDNTIQLHIINRSFQYTPSVKKKECIGYISLLGERVDDKIITKYNL